MSDLNLDDAEEWEIIIAEETNKEYKKIEEGCHDVKLIMEHTANLVQKQGEELDHIEDNIEVISDCVEHGSNSLAGSYNKVTTKRKIYTAVCAGISVVLAVSGASILAKSNK